jgi:DNA-binding LacI/PurR family transcriptional regulator
VQLSRRHLIEGRISFHDTTVAGICATLRRVIAPANRPTALIVLNSQYFLTVAGQLNRMGLKVPEDVSLISADGDPFLNFVVREPARYICSPQIFARGLLGQVMAIIEKGAVARSSILLMPEFVRGESIATPSR